MRALDFKAVEAGKTRTASAAGSSFIYVKSAPFDLKITIDNGNALEVPEGTKIDLKKPVNSEFSIENLGASAADFILVVGEGDYSEPQIAGTVSLKAKNTLNGLAPVVLTGNTQTIPGNESRKELHIQADISNVTPVYLGASAAGAGIPIDAGQTVVLEISGDMDVYGATATDKVNLCEVV